MTPLALVHHLANHRDILPWVAPGHASMDVGHLNVRGARIFGDEAGGVLFVPSPGNPGIFEMHYLFTEAVRGKAALDLARWAITVMFTDHGATAIGGAVPREHRGSRVMTRALGFLPVGTHTDGGGRDCIVYAMERDAWPFSSQCFQRLSVQ